jgi:zinc-binding alcohol dehydrogenase family protein
MVQLIKQLTQLQVIATASRPETTAWLESMGADHIINHRHPLSQEFAKHKLPDVDYVVSLNQTESHYAEIINVIKPQGQFGLIDDPETLDIQPLKPKSLSLHWEFMFTRSMFQTEDMQAQHDLLNQVADMIDSGVLKTTVGEHFGTINASNLRKAHALLESQGARGKIVLEGFS